MLRPDSRPGESDTDFLAEFHPCEAGDLYHLCFGLTHDLRDQLASRIVLVMPEAIRNPFVNMAIKAAVESIDEAG